MGGVLQRCVEWDMSYRGVWRHSQVPSVWSVWRHHHYQTGVCGEWAVLYSGVY